MIIPDLGVEKCMYTRGSLSGPGMRLCQGGFSFQSSPGARHCHACLDASLTAHAGQHQGVSWGSDGSHQRCCAAMTGLQEAGRLRSGETVLVTAAAGGVGQFVVQLAKQAGSTVIATCGSEDKARLLRRLGADRIVNYRQESLKEVLRKEYPKVITPAAAGSKLNVCQRPCRPALRMQSARCGMRRLQRTSHRWVCSKRGADPCLKGIPPAKRQDPHSTEVCSALEARGCFQALQRA